jgi:hypothetical protein
MHEGKIHDKHAKKFGMTQSELDAARLDQDPGTPGIQHEPADIQASPEFDKVKAQIEAQQNASRAKESAWAKKKLKNYDVENLDESLSASLKRLTEEERILSTSGLGGSPLIESNPEFRKLKGENIIKTPNNAYIVLGRDRPGQTIYDLERDDPEEDKSGYGGRGHTSSAAIDLVVGRKGPPEYSGDPPGQNKVNPNFISDSARIYISQKTDIDENFDLLPGPGSPATEAKSGIGLKADTIRIIGRESIRLVTMGPGTRTSFDSEIVSTGGIDLMAGNDDEDMQPLVKGDNLSEALEAMVDLISDTAGIISGFLQHQMELDNALTTHFHNSPFFGLPTTPSQTILPVGNKTMMNLFSKTKLDLVMFKLSLVEYKFKYLSPNNEKDYINSKFNSTN